MIVFVGNQGKEKKLNSKQEKGVVTSNWLPVNPVTPRK
jgi:hypothetical protein